MQRFFSTKLIFVSFLAMLFFASGCGSEGDPINELGYSYYVSSIDLEDRNTATSDLDFLEDCAEGDDEITKASMTVTVASRDDQLTDMYVYKIKLEFDLIDYSIDSGSVDEADIAIPTITYYQTIRIPGEGGSASKELDFLTIADKENYLDRIGNSSVMAHFQAYATVYYTATPQDPEEHYSSEYAFTFNIGNFKDDSCTEEE